MNFLVYMLITSQMTGHIFALRCYSCDNAASDEECINSVKICGVDQSVCYTEVRNNSKGVVAIKKLCYQQHACNNLRSQNGHSCPAVCAMCCSNDLCNKKGPEVCTCSVPKVRRKKVSSVLLKSHQLRSSLDKLHPTTGNPFPRRITTSYKDITTSGSKAETDTRCVHKSNATLIALDSPIVTCPTAEELTSCATSNSFNEFKNENGLFITFLSNNKRLSCQKSDSDFNYDESDADLTRAYSLVCARYVTDHRQTLKNITEDSKQENDLTITCDFSEMNYENNEAFGDCNKNQLVVCFFLSNPPPIIETDAPRLSIAVSEPHFRLLRSTATPPPTSAWTEAIANLEKETITTTGIQNETATTTGTQHETIATTGIQNETITTIDAQIKKHALSKAGTGGLAVWIIVIMTIGAMLVLAVLLVNLVIQIKKRGIYHVNRVSPQEILTKNENPIPQESPTQLPRA